MKKRLASAFQVAGCIVVLGALSARTARTQPAAPDSIPAPSAVLTIVSEPTGALVVLQGAHTIRGRTPFTVTRGLTGRYDIHAYLPGYEDWLGAADFDPSTSRTLAIRFTQKSGWRAAVRSGIFPGWGQRYTGQRGKAAVFGTLELAALALVGYEQYWYSQKISDLEDAEEAYLKGREVDEIQRLYASMESRRRAADQKYDDRRQAVMLAGAIWAVNMLDIVLFQPSRNEGLFSQLGPDGDLRAGLRVEF